ncbi:response regulator [Seleniivibrio woodruffii]|uniref:response regulator n=1 Tax=Seleniivibrio woodruffii TaxID=1078050 RepID=UPI0026E9635D|nr:response regulator [Seleniivibrio woodruffii]
MDSLEKLKEFKVLYVEDDDITREMASRMISKYFKDIVIAADGREGLEKFSSESPDIVITDLSMPEMSGFEMISHIRKMNHDVPIIVTTAYRNETECLEDVNAVVFKPVNKKLLLQAISNLYD